MSHPNLHTQTLLQALEVVKKVRCKALNQTSLPFLARAEMVLVGASAGESEKSVALPLLKLRVCGERASSMRSS